MLMYDQKRAISLRVLLEGMAAFTIFVCVCNIETLVDIARSGETLSHGWTLEFIQSALSDESMLFALPVLSAIPFASSFYDEYKTGMIRYALIRSDKETYLKSKALTAALSGGIMLAAGAFAVFLICCIFLMPLEKAPEELALMNDRNVEGLTLISDMAVAGVQDNESAFAVLQLMIRYFCFGALGSETGLCLSTVANNRYMAWLSPFIVEYLLIIFCERYFTGCVVLYPVEWLSPSVQWPLEGWSICLWMLMLTLLAAWMFMLAAGRRLGDV